MDIGFTSPHPAQVRHLGRVFYEAGLRMQRALAAWVREGGRPDQILVLEHDPVFTLGRNANRRDIHVNDAFLASRGVQVFETDRGGQVTYHGPGQLIAYLLLDLNRAGLGIKGLVHLLETAVMELLADHGISAQVRPDAPGVYVAGAKIASLGLRVRRHCSYHGLALNVDLDLEPFSRINPCGFPGLAVTRLVDLGVELSLDRFAEELAARLADRLDRLAIIQT